MGPQKERHNFFVRHAGFLMAILLTIVQLGGLANALKFEDGFALAGAFLVIPLRFIYLIRFSDISLNFSRVALWFAWDLSMVALPFFLFNDYLGFFYTSMGIPIEAEDIAFTVRMGAAVLVIHFLVSLWWRNERFQEDEFLPSYSDGAFYLWAAAGFLLITASMGLAWYFGTGQLGVEGNRLPFKLSGVINFFAYYFPSFYVLFIADNFSKRGKSLWIPLLIVAFLGGVQMMVSLSKASLIVNLLMVFVYLIIGRRVQMRLMVALAVLILVGFVAGSYLSSYRDSKISDFKTVEISDLEAGYKASSYVHRIFREGHLFQKFHAYSRVADLRDALAQASYNPSDLHTYILDKTPITVMHSSGCSTLVAFYCFGIPYVLIAAAIMSAATVFIDYKLPRLRNPFSALIFRSYIVYFIVINWFLLVFAQVIGVVSLLFFFLDRSRFMMYVVIPIAIWMGYYLYVRFFCKRVPLPINENMNRGTAVARPNLLRGNSFAQNRGYRVR